MYDENGNWIGAVDDTAGSAFDSTNYNDALVNYLYGGENPQGVTGSTGAMEATGAQAGSVPFNWGNLIKQVLGGAASAATGGAGGGLGSIGGLAGGALMLKALYDRFKGQEQKVEALRSQVPYTPMPSYSRALQAPIYGRGGIGETLHFNPVPFQYDPAQAAQQSNMAVPFDASRPAPTPTPYTPVPARPAAAQPQYISDLLSKFQAPVSFAPGAVRKAEGGEIYEHPDEYLDYARGGDLGYAQGGIAGMLKGPGDGMSDHIPATIQGKQPARLSDGEFVIPADVVSHLGNGSSTAGAKRLYDMMAKVRKERTGKTSQAKQVNPNKYVPG